jgi:RNA polymerase sigma-70 factor (ECF subfamily)
VQETLLRAWKYYDSYRGQGTVRAWLYKITTNACLDALSRRAQRELPLVQLPPAGDLQPEPPLALEKALLEPLPESWLAGAAGDPESEYQRRENVRLAFIVALQSLSAEQRAVLILREVLDWSTSEVAEMLDLSLSAVHSALYRARARLRRAYAPEQPGEIAPELEDRAAARLLERYLQAWETADIAGLLALMREDVAFTMPPALIWYQGKAKLRALFTTVLFPGEAAGLWRLSPARANAQPAFGLYIFNPDTGAYHPYVLQVLTIRGEQIAECTNFLYPQDFERFGLPKVLAP